MQANNNPTVRGLLYPGCTAKIIGHTEMWIAKTGHHPMDRTRWPGYDQQTPADVAAHCQRLKALDFDILMPNTYRIGSWENVAFELYIAATQAAGLGMMVNIDKGVYRSQKSPIQAIRDYLTYLRKASFVAPNYVKWNGKFVVTYFTWPTDDPKMFAQIESENPDIEFAYNSPKMGKSQMSWANAKLDAALDSWCATYATKADGGLYIPHASPGFDDTLMVNGKPVSVWPNKDGSHPPARVYPAGGPNPVTLKAHFDVINKHYSTSNQPPFIQLVTINDWDEKTAVEPKADGTGGYFSVPAPPPPPPPPITITRGELWLDGAKLADIKPGAHALTTVTVMSDGSLKKVQSSITIGDGK